jgi:MinD superfamily P-loop ATPase
MKALKILNSLLRMDIWDKQRCNIHNDNSINEAIAELEELVKPKTCDGCKTCKWYIKKHNSINPWMRGKITEHLPRCGCGVINIDFTNDLNVQNCPKYEPNEQL